MLCRKPPVRSYQPDPIIVLFGCRPWPPPPDGKFCPICHGQTSTDRRLVVCGWCHAGSPPLARFVRARQAARNAEYGNLSAAENRAKEELARRHPVLTERDRRRIWNGYRGSFDHESQKLNNLARVGREFLRDIRQTPDFSLILDKRGNIVGRLELDENADSDMIDGAPVG